MNFCSWVPSRSRISRPGGLNAYLHLVTSLIVNRWPHGKLRELLPDRLALTHPDLLLQDGAFRGPLLGVAQAPPATAP
jgi:hypothetical protein